MEKISRENLRPVRTLNMLSSKEIQGLMSSQDKVHKLFRQCALAVLDAGSDMGDVTQLLEAYRDFEIEVIPQSRGPILSVDNAPPTKIRPVEIYRN